MSECLQSVDRIFKKSGEHKNLLIKLWNKTVGKIIPKLAFQTRTQKVLSESIKSVKSTGKTFQERVAKEGNIKSGGISFLEGVREAKNML
jgi:hypothetical protein